MKKLISILVAFAMMAALAVTAAFAEDPPTGTADNSYLVKYLKIDEGVTIPDDTFTFTFAGKASDTVTDYTGLVPDVQTIEAREMVPSASTEDDGALVGKLKIADIFDGITFPRAGEYIYTVTETLPTTSSEGGSYVAQTQVYELHIYVTNGENGTEISQVTVEDVTPDPENENEPLGVKKDPTDQDPSDEDPADETDDLDQDDISQLDVKGFTFVNEYTPDEDKTPEVDPENDKYGAFYAQKHVTGAYADMTQAFPITITVTFPDAYENGDQALNLYKADGTLAGELEDGVATLNLYDGDIVYFKNLPDGAVVTVNEDLTGATFTNAEHYYQSGVTTTNGEAAAAKAGTAKDGSASDQKTNFVADTLTYDDDYAKAKNAVEITNENKYDPGATGILLSNLPYIALALVAIGGLVAYVVVRRRQNDEA